MGLLQREERDALSDLLVKLPNIVYPSVRNQLLSGIPQDLKAQIISIGASKPDLITMVNAVDDENWDEPYQGSWPVLQFIQNAIFHVGKTPPLGQKMQALLDVLTIRAEQWQAGSILPLSENDSKLIDIELPNKHNNEHKTQESNELSLAPSSIDVGIVIALKEEFAEFYNEIKTRCKALRDEETGRYYYQFEHSSVI